MEWSDAISKTTGSCGEHSVLEHGPQAWCRQFMAAETAQHVHQDESISMCAGSSGVVRGSFVFEEA